MVKEGLGKEREEEGGKGVGEGWREGKRRW